MNIAILDLGTNTFHLLIAEVNSDNKWNKIIKERVTVKLGQGMENNTISRAAFTRGIEALNAFRKTVDTNNIHHIYGFGTAALRNAVNGEEFLNEARLKSGFDIKLISGEEEAELIYYGVRQAMQLGIEKSLIMDIGGGSVEFIIANNSEIFWKASFQLGAAFMLTKFNPSDPLTSDDVLSIISHFDSTLQPLFNAYDLHQPKALIGSAGSFETFSSMLRHRNTDTGIHYGKTSHPISIEKFTWLYHELILSTQDERNEMKGLVKMRIDMIVMAALLLNFVIQKINPPEMKLSAYALKEGALWKVISDIKQQS